MKEAFRKPSELLEEKEQKKPVSTRISAADYETLRREGDKVGRSAAWLAGRILEEYAQWLSRQQPKGKK